MTAPGSESRLREPRGIAVTPAPSRLRGETRGQPLSRRETQVLVLSAHGLRRGRIGQRLGIAVQTVQNYRCQAYAKLGVSDQFEAFAALGWLTPPAIEAAA